MSLGHASSECSFEEIRRAKNVERVVRELSGCELVVLSGERAKLLASPIMLPGRSVVKVPHVGNKALNVTFRIGLDEGSGVERRHRRIAMWTDLVLKEVMA